MSPARSCDVDRGDDLDAGVGRVVRRRACPAPRPRRVSRRASGRDRRPARSRRALDRRRRAGRRLRGRDVDDRRLDTDAARPTVEHEVDVGTEVGAHVRGGRRAHASEAVGRRRRDASAERVEQRERDRMIGNAQPDRRRARPSPRPRSRSGRLRTHERQRPGPERGGQRARDVGDVARESSSCAPAAMCTITGWSSGRPLHRGRAACNASGFAASAPSPYTVSVGNATKPPRRSTATAASMSVTGSVTSS